jgi:hypothetical protein
MSTKDNEKVGGKNEVNREKGLTEVDKFDLDNLRLSQNFTEMVGVKKKVITVPARKPDRQWFIRVHPEDSYRLETAMLEIKEDREFYLVDRALWSELPGEIIPIALFTAVNRQGVLFFWPVRLPDSHGRQLEWHRSALLAAEEAMKTWVRVAANMSLGAYEVFQATGELPEPEWPELTFQQLLEIAFKDRFIRSMDHIAIRKLRGEI